MQTDGLSLAEVSSVANEIRRLELVSRRTVDADLMGRYRSAFRGSGLLFSDIREYQPGDDTRQIHWKVTARTGRVYVKSYEEDRQLRIILAVDISNSTAVRSPPASSRHRRALEFSALLSFLAAQSGDSLGLLLFSSQVEKYLPPQKNRLQTKKILRELTAPRTLTKGTDLRAALEFLNKNERRAALVFVVSDFYSEDYESALAALSHRHDVVAVMLDDPGSSVLPPVGLVEVEDAELGTRRLIDSSASQKKLQLLKSTRWQQMSELTKRCQVDLIRIQDSVYKPLQELMRMRTKRLR